MYYWVVIEYLCLFFIAVFEAGNMFFGWESETTGFWAVLVFAVLKQIQKGQDL